MQYRITAAVFTMVLCLLTNAAFCRAQSANDPTPSDGSAAVVKLAAPSYGIYHAAYPDFGGTEDLVTSKRITGFESLVGKKITWAYFSNNWMDASMGGDGLNFPKTSVAIISSLGRVPFIRMMPRSDWDEGGPDEVYTMTRIIEGEFDNQLRQWARDARATEIPLLVEFGTEVNGDWFPWNGRYCGGGRLDGYGNDTEPDGPERFKDAYIHIIELFRDEGVGNITWFFHVDAFSSPDVSWNAMDRYYPGDDYIDWIGVSLYGPQSSTEGWWDLFSEMMDDGVYESLLNISTQKPIAILEFAVAEMNDADHSKAAWITDAMNAFISNRYPEIKAISWWHENFDGTYLLRLDTSQAALKAYRNGISNQIFVTDPEWTQRIPIPHGLHILRGIDN
jgi:hypothetical protein